MCISQHLENSNAGHRYCQPIFTDTGNWLNCVNKMLTTMQMRNMIIYEDDTFVLRGLSHFPPYIVAPAPLKKVK